MIADLMEKHFKISTHTSLAGRDSGCVVEIGTSNDFYSHVPRGT